MKPTLLLLILINFSAAKQAAGNNFDLNENCKNAYEQVFLLNFQKAEKLLADENRINPDNSAVFYIRNYIYFLRAFLSEEPYDYDVLKKNTDIALKEIDKTDPKSPWKNLARGEILLRLAIIKLKRKEYLSSGYYIRKSYRILEANHQRFPGFTPNLKPLGFFHAVIGSVPENYKWLSNLAGMRGTIEQGAGELSVVLNYAEKNSDHNFIFEEVLFLKIFIATHLQKDPDSGLRYLQKFKSGHAKSSALKVFIEANTLISAGKYDDALHLLNTFQPSPSSYPVYYLDYMKGMLLLNRLDKSGETFFRKFADHYKGNSFVKSAWHKIAWLHLIGNDEKGYQHNLEMVRVKGNDFTDEDKQALKEANSGEIPNVTLLRSRLLFDGGNYAGALAELAGKPAADFPKLKDKIEFTYRLARIFDKKNMPEKAIQYYTSTYENGKDMQWYFAANAALLMGNIYEELNNNQAATEWYKKCLALRNHEYQNSIDQKAEAGLNRIRR